MVDQLAEPANGVDEVDEVDELNSLGCRKSRPPRRGALAFALGLVVITGWDRSLLPTERGGVFDPWLAC